MRKKYEVKNLGTVCAGEFRCPTHASGSRAAHAPFRKALSGGVQATFQRSRRSGQAAVEFVCVRARACSSHPERAPHEKGPTIRRGTTDSSPPDKRDRRVGGFGEKNSHKIRPKIESNMNRVKESHSGGTARAKGSLEAAVAQKSENHHWLLGRN